MCVSSWVRSCTLFLPSGFKHSTPSNHRPCPYFGYQLSQNSLVALFFFFFSLRYKFSVILRPDCDMINHTYIHEKNPKIKVIAGRNINANCCMLCTLGCKSVPIYGLLPCVEYDMKTVHACSLGKWNWCSGHLLLPPGDGSASPPTLLSPGTLISPGFCVLCQSLQMPWVSCGV